MLPHLYLRGWWWGPAEERPGLVAGVVPAAHAPGAVVVRDVERQDVLRRETDALRAEPALGADVPTVIVVHALTADAVLAGDDGWWAPLVGPGCALDPETTRILCFNNLGSCYGSFGPVDPGFPTAGDELSAESTIDLPPDAHPEKGWFDLPPEHPGTITTWDQARAIWRALDRLGIEQVEMVTGGSLGGMIAFAMAMLAPRRIRTLAPIAASTAATPWVQGWNHAGRAAILADPGFPDGAGRGLEIARQIAHMTYRAEPGLVERQSPAAVAPSAAHPLPIQTYLEHQGKKLRGRFHARAYLAQLTAMDRHDILRPPPEPEPEHAEAWTAGAEWTLDRITSRIRAIGIDSDQLYFPTHLRALVDDFAERDRDAKYLEIRSPHGHDAFLIEWDQMERALRWALEGA